MASKAVHLKAILAQKLTWTSAEKLQAQRLAGIREHADKLANALNREGYTVPTAAGGTKANPKAAARERLVREDTQLVRQLQLGAVRTADNGRSYKAAGSPVEVRSQLWEQWGQHCQTNLIPGLWLFQVRQAGCEVPADAAFAIGNPTELPR